MKLDKNKVIAILLEEAKKDPTLLMKVVELLPLLIAVYERVVAEAGKSEAPKVSPPSTGGTEPPPSEDEPESWLENVFHSWYQDEPNGSDMTTSDEVAAIVAGKADVPPGSVLWLMCDRPDALWCFTVDGSRVMTFTQKGEQKFFTGPVHEWFVGARYKEQPGGVKDARHIILSLLPVEGRHNLTFWVRVGELDSAYTTIEVGGKKR